jgi:hypothetical protein
MITLVFYAFLCLGLIILQTTILSNIPWPGNCYDLLIPFVLYLGIYRPMGEGLFMVITLGLVMDTISSGPLGLYGAAYLSLFCSYKWGTRFFHVGNRLFLPVVVASGVLLENLLYILTIALSTPFYRLPEDGMGIVAGQVLLALLTGIFPFMWIRSLHRAWDRWYYIILEREKQNGI